MDDIPPDVLSGLGQDDPAFEARVLRAFIRKGRLVSIPARDRKRRVVLRYLLDQVFPDLEPVAERDVNMRLALWHPDVSALRRYLVDAGLVTRAEMVYRRAEPLADREEPPGARAEPLEPDRPEPPTEGAEPPTDRPGGPPFV